MKMNHDNDFDKMPVVMRVALLAGCVLTAPIWFPIMVFDMAFRGKDFIDPMSSTEYTEKFFSNIRKEVENDNS